MSNKAFAVIVQELRDGRTHSELSTGLNDLLAAVAMTGKGGTVTLKIEVKPASKGSEVDKVMITDKVTVTLPKPERGTDVYWLTSDNELSRSHPRQSSLDLRQAPSAQPTTLKEAIQ
ncbi:hypothetical protein [Duganella sp.]|uniref:hypothetical protein n=1 Tax=Duganella sp. TaxID=1904440 RepID=UPI0031E2C005